MGESRRPGTGRREFRKLTREVQLPRSAREDGQIADLLFMATAAPIFSNIWLGDALASALDQSLPTILNSDGDEVVFCRVRFLALRRRSR